MMLVIMIGEITWTGEVVVVGGMEIIFVIHEEVTSWCEVVIESWMHPNMCKIKCSET